jgi:hypothetical protein
LFDKVGRSAIACDAGCDGSFPGGIVVAVFHFMGDSGRVSSRACSIDSSFRCVLPFPPRVANDAGNEKVGLACTATNG